MNVSEQILQTTASRPEHKTQTAPGDAVVQKRPKSAIPLRWAAHYATLLNGVLAPPSKPLWPFTSEQLQTL